VPVEVAVKKVSNFGDQAIMEHRVKDKREVWSWLELFPANKCGALPRNNAVGAVFIFSL